MNSISGHRDLSIASPIRNEQGASFAVTLMEHLVVPTFVLDREGRVLVWNKACERLTGVPAAEMLGTREHWRAFYDEPRPCLADLVVRSDWTVVDDLYATHEAPGTHGHGVHAENWCHMPRLGRKLYLAVDAGPVFDEAGNLLAVVETLRDFTEKKLAQSRMQEQADLLQRHFEEHQRENELARRILDHQIRADLLAQSGVHHFVVPASHFSGDLILAARSRDGRLYAILADATGHGLSAAVSVLPVVQEFYRLVEEGAAVGRMVESINLVLGNSLPVGRFVAAALVCVDESARRGEIWVGGLPPVLMLDAAGGLLRSFESSHLPLGICKEPGRCGTVESFAWEGHCRLAIMSDGVVEATNSTGEAFGAECLLASMLGTDSVDLARVLKSALTSHLDGQPAHDDMSVLSIECPA